MNATRDLGALVGRVLLALLFVISGYGKIGGFAGAAGYMASKGMPMVDVLLVLTIVVELGGGLLLIVGWQTRWVALIMAAFLIPVTLIFHNFWAMPAEAQSINRIMFLKNLSIMGGLLVLASFGPGRLSADRG